MADIVLHLNDYRLEALEKAMDEKGLGGVEDYLQDYLIEMYSDHVPIGEQRRIYNRINAERERENPEPEPVAEPVVAERSDVPTLTAARPLQPEDIVFRESVLPYKNLLNFKLEPNSSLHEALGVHDDILKPGGLISVYINYDLATEKPGESLDVTLSSEKNGGMEEFRYPLSREELAILLPKMDAYHKRTRGISLSERTAAYQAGKSQERKRRTGPGKRKKNPER